MGVTRIFEKIEEGIRNQEAEMAGIKKKVFNWAQKQALHHHEQVSDICDTRVHIEELRLECVTNNGMILEISIPLCVTNVQSLTMKY